MIETIEVVRVKRFAANTAGRDYAVGDIHGHFTRLQAALDAAGFDPAVDRLFSVGDLVDRGPECEDVIKWLNKPWFHPVRGNHDDYVCRFDTCDIGNWMYNGGTWFVGLPLTEQQNYQVMFDDLPIAIEVKTAGGMIGIVHADCVFGTWAELKAELESPETRKRLKLVHNTCMWSRSRVENRDMTPVSDMRAVVVGHTPLRQPMVLGNVHHIDTGGWFPDGSGYFTLLELGTLTTIPATRPELLQDLE
ncbi:serine/threonine protein phosphatase [Pseudomonas helleri]|uniref:Serine/threonine protein phosphatase n=1 Tax=Pseudomonas helleri TaxID=1608996 RepID=A0A7X1XYC1_9PSED|nr:metallophosphoesterase [Pseudomonas helleri]MQU27232.1 serine/threonine protein phosphatase [Pseudomonas helleri]